METIEEMLAKRSKRRAEDAIRFKELKEECQLCGADGPDKRMLRIRCMYDIKEVMPEAIELKDVDDIPEGQQDEFFLQICKSCRGHLLELLCQWRKERVALRPLPKDHDGYILEEEDTNRNIPVRIAGRTVWMNEEEYANYSSNS